VQDPLGNVTTNTYDAASRQTEQQDPLGNRTTFVYDSVNNRTAVVNALSKRTTFAYDALNRTEAGGSCEAREVRPLRTGGWAIGGRLDVPGATSTNTIAGPARSGNSHTHNRPPDPGGPADNRDSRRARLPLPLTLSSRGACVRGWSRGDGTSPACR